MVLADGVGEESVGMLQSKEVANACALANEWAEEELWVERIIQEAMDKYQASETDPESVNY